MSKPNRPSKQLVREWRERLEQAGFSDIETAGRKLKSYDGDYFYAREKRNPGQLLARERYYTLATHFLHEWSFKNETEFQVWELHSQGYSFAEIGEKLNVHKSYAGKLGKRLQQQFNEWRRDGKH